MYECLFGGIVIREISDRNRKKTKTYRLSIDAKYLDEALVLDGAPLIISVIIDIADLILSKNLSETQTTKFVEDEYAFIL